MRKEIREELNKNKANIESESIFDLKHLVISLVLMVLIFLGILYLFYFLLYQNSISKMVKQQYRPWVSHEIKIAGDKKTENQNAGINAQSLANLKESLLKNNFFDKNTDYSIKIPLTPVGKANPFVENSPGTSDLFVVSDDEITIDESEIPVIKNSN